MTKNVGLAEVGAKTYDIRDDQTVPVLQTATYQITAYRDRALRLR
jgi:hypothetical protein